MKCKPDLWAKIFLLLAASMLALPAVAQIYKYQDENGRWHFTDKKPEQVENVENIGRKPQSIQTDIETSPAISEKLNQRFNNSSGIEKVTLSVVTVYTTAGQGSGFFVSEDGYLITNRHVIRPKVRKKDAEKSEEIKARLKTSIKNAKKNIANYKKRLKQMKPRLDQYKSAYQNASSKSQKQDAKQRYRDYKQRYDDYLAALKKNRQSLDKNQKQLKSLTQKRDSYENKVLFAQTAQTFDIKLKNGQKYRAELVSISQNHDLALLKMIDQTTPMVEVNLSGSDRQGDKVFAIGTPRGQSDYVTSGVITRINSKYIMTDADVLPGNSGGPLVNEDGAVIGINTIRQELRGFNTTVGFGGAIPIRLVYSEFRQYLRRPASSSQ